MYNDLRQHCLDLGRSHKLLTQADNKDTLCPIVSAIHLELQLDDQMYIAQVTEAAQSQAGNAVGLCLIQIMHPCSHCLTSTKMVFLLICLLVCHLSAMCTTPLKNDEPPPVPSQEKC